MTVWTLVGAQGDLGPLLFDIVIEWNVLYQITCKNTHKTLFMTSYVKYVIIVMYKYYIELLKKRHAEVIEV